MRTLEELKQANKIAEEDKIFAADNKKNSLSIYVYDVRSNEQLRKSSLLLENLEEATHIKIAHYANKLWNQLLIRQSILSPNLTLFEILKKHVNELTSIGYNFYYTNEFDEELTGLITYFRFVEEDLNRLSQQPNVFLFRDEFMNFINDSYGTTIPLSQEWKDLMLESELTGKINNKTLSLLKLRNGELCDAKGYPLVYRQDILAKYESKKILKKTK